MLIPVVRAREHRAALVPNDLLWIQKADPQQPIQYLAREHGGVPHVSHLQAGHQRKGFRPVGPGIARNTRLTMALGTFLHVAGLGVPQPFKPARGGANYDSLSYSLQPNSRILASHRRARRPRPRPQLAPPPRTGAHRPPRVAPEPPTEETTAQAVARLNAQFPWLYRPSHRPAPTRNSRGSGAPSSAPAANHHRLGATDCHRIRRSGRRWEGGVRRAWRIARQRLSAASAPRRSALPDLRWDPIPTARECARCNRNGRTQSQPSTRP